ncbi:hypothetical protein BDY19DRAFT_68270 [Irpex rosettiformis]|uniref:Uncharacterized protein n=1 Tax=Irpex rosettiformis TaxID=378272 RepID=A0ACB8ULW4_9APHY|nr:hypothetical protein BDY19DRAFT_68270 [Irpex rosettiformis]
MRGNSDGSAPRTPRSARSARSAPNTPQMAQRSPQIVQFASGVARPVSPSPMTARSDVSPRLMLHTPANGTHLLVGIGGDDSQVDPFADPVAIARVRDLHRSLTPTIRESDATLVDQAPVHASIGGGRPVSEFQTVPEDSVLDPFKDPAPQLYVSPPGARNRLSNISSQRSSLITDDSSMRGVAM